MEIDILYKKLKQIKKREEKGYSKKWKDGFLSACNEIEKFVKKKSIIIHHVVPCHDSVFHGIDVLEMEDKIGFEGYYMGDINHPDHRPAHAIWIDKKDSEKLIRIFYQKFAERVRKKGYDFSYNFEELNKEDKQKDNER
jgi:hypothetical protein